MKKYTKVPKGYKLVLDETLTEEQKERLEQEDREDCLNELATLNSMNSMIPRLNPFAALDEFHNYFPGNNEVPKEGAWIMLKTFPPTEFTVTPFSFWFATPWPMQCTRRDPHRVKIVTPRGDIGLFPHEYVRVENPEKYFEFIGDGMEIKFFTNLKEDALPKDKLFYLRSRGIAKKDALAMLIGSIKSHGVFWLETQKEIAMTFCRDWPSEERLATVTQQEPAIQLED